MNPTGHVNQWHFLTHIGFGICAVGVVFYLYVDKQNDLIKLQIKLPQLQKELHILEEQNRQLLFEIEQLENPARLMELRKNPRYGHLKEPHENEILIFEEFD